jgi:hypothetical protein
MAPSNPLTLAWSKIDVFALPVADDADVLDIVTQLYKDEPFSGATGDAARICGAVEICVALRAFNLAESKGRPPSRRV